MILALDGHACILEEIIITYVLAHSLQMMHVNTVK